MIREYQTIREVAGPIVIVDRIANAAYGEIVDVQLGDGTVKRGQVLETYKGYATVQVFGQTTGIDVNTASVRFKGETLRLAVSDDMLGRVFSGLGEPIDGGPKILSSERVDINGSAINPASRAGLSDFIQTGISTIDVTNTLVRGQKLPIFSASGLPHNELAVQIANQSTVRSKNSKEKDDFVVVFAAMGITHAEARFFMRDFERTGALERSVLFLNLASDPSSERIITPRLALTTAEYLAFEKDAQVLVILTDMTNYCDALREIASARQEVPGRRGYPGYMYTDLASIYERAGQIKGKKGTVTQMPILTMPDEDITHPIPDLTGYITEGQLVLSRDLYRKDIYPNLNVLPSLSRLQNQGIGKDKTREDHAGLASQLYAGYAEGGDLRNLVVVVGEDALTARDKKYLRFADAFEKRFVAQAKSENRTIEESLEIGWELLSMIPQEDLKRVKPEYVQKYLKKPAEATAEAEPSEKK